MVADASVLSVPGYCIRLMIWRGLAVPCSVNSRRTVMSPIEPTPWWPRIGMPLIFFATSTALPALRSGVFSNAVVARGAAG